MSLKLRLGLYLASGAFLLAIDQSLKYLARTHQDFALYIVKPWLGWEYFGNPGIAFGLPVPNLALLLVTPFIVIGFFVLLFKYRTKKVISLGLALIIAGAISNYIDRVLFGITIDYIKVLTSVFNLADALVVTGALMLLLQNQNKFVQSG